MNSHSNKKHAVAILGATGYVGRTLASLLAVHPLFETVALIGSPASAGRRFGDVWTEKEAKLATHYGAIWTRKQVPDALADTTVLSLDPEALRDVDFVFSSVPETAAQDEQKILNAGIRLISNNPYGRLTNPLIIPELQTEKPSGRLIKMPNCVSIGISLALAPLKAHHVKTLQATTFQSLSGQGDCLYPQDWAVGNVFPIGPDVEKTQSYIADELKTLLGLHFLPQIRSYRVYVQEGHLIDVTLRCEKTIDIHAVISLWKTWNPLNRKDLPLRVSTVPGEPKSQDTLLEDGMPVRIGNIQQIDSHTIAFTLGIHNIMRGAAGNAILTAEWMLDSEM